MGEVWLEQVEQIAKEEILPFATMEKITEAAEKHKLDARSLMELMKILWANDLVGYYEIEKILKKKANAIRVKAIRNQCRIKRGIYLAFVVLTEAEYFILIRERQNLLEDPAHSRQMNRLKQKIFYLYKLLKGDDKEYFSPKILERFFPDQDLIKQITDINPDNSSLCYITLKDIENVKEKTDEFLNNLITKHEKLTRKINLIKKLPQEIETHLETAKQTYTPIKEKIDNLIFVLEKVEMILEKERKDKKILKKLNKNKENIKKAFKTLSTNLHNLEILSLELTSLMEFYITDKKINQLKEIESQIQQLKKACDGLAAFIENKKKEKNQISECSQKT